MTPETETLLKRCRTALLERSDEELDTLLQRWFEGMIGEESMEEVLDDLCLLLGYRVRSWGQQTSYATYTAWWEVEGYCAEEGGEFLCTDVVLLRHHLLDMSIKQFALVPDLARRALSMTAYDQGEPLPPTGYIFLYAFAEWLHDVMREFGDVHMQYKPPKQVNSKAQKRQRRERAKDLIAQARQQGYVVVYPDTMEAVKSAFRHWCKVEVRPYICVEARGAQVAKVFADMKTLGTLWVVMTTPQIQDRLVALATPYISRAQEQQQQARLHWETQWLVIFEEILMEDAEQVARDLVALS